MPLNFKNKLDFQSFEQFAKENASYAFMQALTATHNDKKSEKLAANALFAVLKNRKHFDAEDKLIDERTAIDLSLRSLLSAREKDMLDNAPTQDKILDEILEDDDKTKDIFTVYPPDESSQRKIVSKACAKAESITPKYAPVYSGTKSGIILLIVLVFICAAIYFIWNDPAELLSDKSASHSTAGVSVSVPDSEGLIDVDFETYAVSQGSVPVKIYISGPDRKLVSSVTYSHDNSSVITSAYQCGDEYWVMTVNSGDYFKVNIRGTGGLDVVKYFRLGDTVPTAPEVTVLSTVTADNYSFYTVSVSSLDDITVSSGDIIDIQTDENGNYVIGVPNGSESTLEFCDNSGNKTAMFITSDGKALPAPRLNASEISIGHDSVKEIDLNALLPSDTVYTVYASSKSENLSASVGENNLLTLTAQNSFVGIDSIELTVEDSYGNASEIALPVVVVNSAPYYTDASELYASVVHTPGNTGHLFGTLSATDAQNDRLTYTLTGRTDCSVTLSPGGSFMLFIDEGYRGHSASFDFTVSDGILSSEPYRYTVSLENNILSAKEYSQKFVCYTGENGWYTVELPKVDSDGDTLSWSVLTELTEDGRTPAGNYISFADGLSTVLIRPNPELNGKFSETISLTCSDGWLTSDVITVKCSFSENKPPEAGKQNKADVSASQTSGTFTLDIRDDCEFDKCAIIGVVSCVGGEVVENIGWNTLAFTVNFDTSADITEPVEVVLLVEDIVTKETVEVEFIINRITD